MKVRRVAFHFTDLSSGGVEKMRLALSRELIRLGYDVDLVVCRASGEYRDQVPAGVRLVDLKAKRARNSLFPLIRYLRDERPDVLVSSMGIPNIVSLIAGMLTRKRTPIYVTQHNALTSQARSKRDFQQALVPVFYRMLLPRADGVLAVSSGVADDMAKATGFPRENITVLYNPAYPQELEKALAEAFDQPFFEQGEPVVVAVGRLIEQKAFDNLIDAIALVNTQRSVRLAILGVGPLRKSLEEQVKKLDLQSKVHFYGFQANPLIFMKHAALVAMSSRYEGFGNVLVEALACETPTVSTDCPSGPSEVLADGLYGLLVPVGDVNAISQAILKTLSSDIDRISLANRAQEFSAEAVTQRYLAAIFPYVAEKVA